MQVKAIGKIDCVVLMELWEVSALITRQVISIMQMTTALVFDRNADKACSLILT